MKKILSMPCEPGGKQISIETGEQSINEGIDADDDSDEDQKESSSSQGVENSMSMQNMIKENQMHANFEGETGEYDLVDQERRREVQNQSM